jgi:hypothetical protein
MPQLTKSTTPHLPCLEVPTGLSGSDEVYLVRLTGEVCVDYDAYLAKLELYRSRQWSCALTGRAGLTYEEAVRTELRTAKTVPSVRYTARSIAHCMNARVRAAPGVQHGGCVHVCAPSVGTWCPVRFDARSCLILW